MYKYNKKINRKKKRIELKDEQSMHRMDKLG